MGVVGIWSLPLPSSTKNSRSGSARPGGGVRERARRGGDRGVGPVSPMAIARLCFANHLSLWEVHTDSGRASAIHLTSQPAPDRVLLPTRRRLSSSALGRLLLLHRLSERLRLVVEVVMVLVVVVESGGGCGPGDVGGLAEAKVLMEVEVVVVVVAVVVKEWW